MIRVNFMTLLFWFHMYVYVNVCIVDCNVKCISHSGPRSKKFLNYFLRESQVSKSQSKGPRHSDSEFEGVG